MEFIFAFIAIWSSKVEVEFELNSRMNANKLGRCQNNRYYQNTLILTMSGMNNEPLLKLNNVKCLQHN